MAGLKQETICAIASGRSPAAIGVVRLSGLGAKGLLARCVGRVPRPRRLGLRALRDPRDGSLVDEALVVWFPAPRSFTGEDVCEIYGHGGELNLHAIQALFLRNGARLAEPGEFSRRAFLNGRLDLVQAEAIAEIIEARSERGLANAQAVLAGELGRRLTEVEGLGLGVVADLEACIDFADDTSAAVPYEELGRQLGVLEHAVGSLVAGYDERGALGSVSVALVGVVNAGKSSLLNALVGRRRALVSGDEGTTRDFLEETVSWGGLSLILVDTAGQRREEAMSALEREGHRLGNERVARCELVLQVVDCARSLPALESALAALPADALLVANKLDLLECAARQELEVLLAPLGRRALAVSAETGEGLAELKERVVAAALPQGGGESFCITQQRQIELLRRGLEWVRSAQRATLEQAPPELVVEHLREFLALLGELFGRRYSENVLDLVFSRFCIGK